MIEYWHLFLAFFIPGIVAYGGGPASIPLIEHEVVRNYSFMTTTEFGELIALANALPGPIATKLAGYIGYEVAGVLGATITIVATVFPSLIVMIILLSILGKYRHSPKVKRSTAIVRPTITILLDSLTFRFLQTSYETAGVLQTVILIGLSYICLERLRIHPACVVAGSLVYGAIFLS